MGLTMFDTNVGGVQAMIMADASRTRPSAAERARSNR